MQPIIEAETLSKQYVTYKRGDSFGELVRSMFHREKIVVDAVHDVSFSVGEGEILGILGPNGAGKSTTIKMLTGVLFPSGGRVRALNYDPARQRSKYVRHIGAVFGQKSQLIFDIPPLDAFAMNRAIYGIPPGEYQETLDEMVELLGIDEVIRRPTRALSLGERMKCEFVMAMLHRPKIVFLDEPTIGLDIMAKEAIRGFIRGMNRKGTTFLLTTHDLEDVERLARRIIVINHGEKVFEDELTNLKKYLGNHKTLRVVMQTQLPSIDWPGVTLLSRESDNEARLLVDNDVLPMPEMIARLGQLGPVQDASLMEIPIEEVIKAIYGGGER